MSNDYIPFELEPSWLEILKDEFKKPYISHLKSFLEIERLNGSTIFPPQDLIFNAFWQTPFHKVRVLILGQDPYHGPGQAHGLCFSVPMGVPPPPSLINIYKELDADIGMKSPKHGCLLKWASQGILLLNTTLTVRQGEALSHAGKGWEKFTDAVISAISNKQDPVIFVLWGKNAQDKFKRIPGLREERHTILTAAHPSPLSAYNGFFGCKHFSMINEILQKNGHLPIDWHL